MNDFLQMDIFFFVTTVAVIVLAVFGSLALWRLERVLKDIEHISGQVAAESDNVRLDLAEMRADIRQGTGRIRSLLGLARKVKKRAEKS
jgi:hypothetical protein